ncbi:MAG TPA: HDOD domain-containing protein [Methylophaga sp.]|nr:HDOD domain-containing protein [Methylophaga sp.]
MAKQGEGVQRFIRQLSEDKMPVFSNTVTEVTNVVSSQDTSAVDVARVILRDAALTGRLLKMANSMHYNRQGQVISTVSRAVMVIGFEQVKALALTLVLVDSLADGKQRQKLIEEMAQSFHAAIQAQELAVKMKLPQAEDIFIAALLSRLGNMAFWAFADNQAEQILDLINKQSMPEEAAEMEVLGFTLQSLTRGLSEAWLLGDMLEKSLNPRNHDAASEIIRSANQLAMVSQQGWENPQTLQWFTDTAKQLDMKQAELTDLVYRNAQQARQITRLCGINDAELYIAIPPNTPEDLPESDVVIDIGGNIEIEPVANDEPPRPDAMLQLQMLQDISAAIQEKPGLNVILEMVLEGIYRGIAMDRAIFTVLSPDRKKLQCKYALGADNEKLTDDLIIDITHPTNVFAKALKETRAQLLPADPRVLNGTLAKTTLDLLGKPPYLLMPAIVAGKVIGLFIADRNLTQRSIDKADQMAFQQFCQQANMGLTFLKLQG